MDKKNILMVIDDSGSMISIIGTVKEKISEVVAQNRDANFIFWSFGSRDQIRKISLSEVDSLNAGSGMTALYEASIKAVNDLGEMYSKRRLEIAKTIVFVITDGLENNSSPEYTKEEFAGIMKHQQEKYGWEFHFYGSEFEQVKESQEIGFRSSVPFEKNTRGVEVMFTSISKTITPR